MSSCPQQSYASPQVSAAPSSDRGFEFGLGHPSVMPASAASSTLPGANPRMYQTPGGFSSTSPDMRTSQPAAGSMWSTTSQDAYRPPSSTMQSGLSAGFSTQPAGDSSPLSESSTPTPVHRGRPHRAMSLLSQEAIAALHGTATDLGELEAEVEEAVNSLKRGEITPGLCRDRLSQVESKVQKLETNRVDSIYTGSLNSGKAQAKTEKKEQLDRIERLCTRLEQLFKWIKTLPA
mmetsp:Transcript_88929/g.163029  ORF Transcript_88929/g.163029 Transcript_88929/m.163029 type:complete len:234 (+) Transcript_88929:1-702(+)